MDIKTREPGVNLGDEGKIYRKMITRFLRFLFCFAVGDRTIVNGLFTTSNSSNTPNPPRARVSLRRTLIAMSKPIQRPFHT